MSFRQTVSFKRLLRSGEKCCKGGRWKPSIQTFEILILRRTSKNRRNLLSRKYRPKRTYDFKIVERGKWRKIRAHDINDRQIYKSFCRFDLKPSTDNLIVPNNSASQIGKGTQHSIKTFRKGLSKAYRKYGRDFYVVTFDYHDYFGTINHDKIQERIELKDEGSRWLLSQYIGMFEGENGIGIGGEPSQDISIVFPSSVDRMLLCEKCVIFSGRYMDDGFAIVHTREEAKYVLNKIVRMSEKLGLVINYKRTKISYMEKDCVVWLKKRTKLLKSGKIVMELTKENVKSEIHNITRQKELIDKGVMPRRVADQSIECWMSYARNFDSYNQMWRVLDHYSTTFNVPWQDCKQLLKKNHKGWIQKMLMEHDDEY